MSPETSGNRTGTSPTSAAAGSRLAVMAPRVCFIQTLAVLLLGLVSLPAGWARARSALDSARSHEMNRADREVNAGGYYQGLIGVDGPQGAPAELALRLLGKPSDWVRFRAANVSRVLEGDFLIFELQPNVNRLLFGQPFTTNAFSMRDRPYTLEKPAGTFRVAVLGSSIDMGWGVGTQTMYVSRLEEWLNAHAVRRGLHRRFEVLNFAVAAYSPMQRLESFRRKAVQFHPDLVLYAATLLDLRLLEIHLCDMLERAVREAGVTPFDLRLDSESRLIDKDALKRKLRPYYWPIYDATLETLVADCRSMGIPVACVIIPRVGKIDAPEARAETEARLHALLSRHCRSVFDLAGTFDKLDAAELELAPWDDHPNSAGHRRLFLALARALVKDPLYPTLFPTEATSTTTERNPPASE